MPRGLVLIKFNGSFDTARDVLEGLRGDRQFVVASNSLVEAWCPCLGTADYAVRVFSTSFESLRRAASGIRDKLSNASGNNPAISTLTTTIAGSTLIEMEDPYGLSRTLLAAATSLGTQGSKSPDSDAALVGVLDLYARDSLDTIAANVKSLGKASGQHDQKYHMLASEIQRLAREFVQKSGDAERETGG